MEIGKKYFYEKHDNIKSGVLQRITRAFYIFDNGDYIERFKTIYNTQTEAETTTEIINKIVKDMYINTYVPEVVHLPNKFIK